MADIAIIGAGIAGLTAASALAGAGHAVRVFEKSGGLGGRLATRRSAAGSFDHGAPGFTAADPDFAAMLATGAKNGHTAAWPKGDRHLLSHTHGPAYVGLPGASSAIRALLDGEGFGQTHIARRAEVTALTRVDGRWHLSLTNGAATADTLLLAIPAPQAARLLAAAGIEEPALSAIDMTPLLSAMVAFEEPLAAPATLAPPLAKALREGDKPGRSNGADRWVLHADPSWSAAHVEDDKDAIAASLIGAFAESAGPLPPETYRAGHRWRFALTTRPLAQPCLWHADTRIGLCGDWCLGDTVEHAFLSGRALAAAVRESLA